MGALRHSNTQLTGAALGGGVPPALADHAATPAGAAVVPDTSFIEHWNRRFAGLEASARVRTALEQFPGLHVLSSSFGAQAAVSLHLLVSEMPDVPVVLVDTGYLFPETYRFVDQLTDRLRLNLKVYRSPVSPAWQEARFGHRWNQGLAGIEAYNEDNKVEPMRRALAEPAIKIVRAAEQILPSPYVQIGIADASITSVSANAD